MAVEKIYIVEVDTLERLECQYIPKELIDNTTADLNIMKTIARNNPFVGFNGQDNEISFTLDFYSQQEDRMDVEKKCNWLKSLAYDSGFTGKPTRLRIVWGDLLNKYTFALKKCNIVKSLPNKFHDAKFLVAKVDLSFVIDMDNNLVKSDIR